MLAVAMLAARLAVLPFRPGRFQPQILIPLHPFRAVGEARSVPDTVAPRGLSSVSVERTLLAERTEVWLGAGDLGRACCDEEGEGDAEPDRSGTRARASAPRAGDVRDVDSASAKES